MSRGLDDTQECNRVTECRVCKSKECYPVLDLGYHPLADTFLAEGMLSEPEVHYPLRTMVCPGCGLMQTEFVISARARYQKNPYCYESSSSATAVQHFISLAERVCGVFPRAEYGFVVDVGSNVGTLLKAFLSLGYEVMGLDPSPNVARKANAAGIETVNDFLTESSAREIIKKKRKADVITATNVFNHADNLDGFMKAVDTLLRKGGVLIVEVPYLLDLVGNLAYDTIYHEHVSYFPLKSFRHLFSRTGYEVFHAERIDYLGGTLRIFAGRQGEHRPDYSVTEMLGREEDDKLYEPATFNDFASRVYRSRDDLISFLYKLKSEGNRIVGIGAPTKGNTLLNFCKIGPNLLEFTSDRIPDKIGRYMPGSHIPIVDDETVCRSNPDYALLLSWNLADEIIGKLREVLQFKGKFIIPVPTAHIT